MMKGFVMMKYIVKRKMKKEYVKNVKAIILLDILDIVLMKFMDVWIHF